MHSVMAPCNLVLNCKLHISSKLFMYSSYVLDKTFCDGKCSVTELALKRFSLGVIVLSQG